MNGQNTDVYWVTSVYGEEDTLDKLENALKAEEENKVGLFYLNKGRWKKYIKENVNTKQKRNRYSRVSSRLLLPESTAQDDSFMRSINAEGSPVKGLTGDITKTEQFRKWFGKSVVANEGVPIVLHEVGRETGGADYNTLPKVVTRWKKYWQG